MAEQNNGKTQQLIAEFEGIHQRLSDLEQLLVHDELKEQLVPNLLPKIPAATYITQNGVIKFISPQLRDITGYSENELIDTNPLSLVMPEDRSRIEHHTIKALKEGSSFVHEYRIITKSANPKWVLESTVPISYNGERAMATNWIDITKNKKAQESLKNNQEKYYDLCENSNDMIQCVTPAGQILYVNRAWRETLGYRKDEIANLSVFEISPADHRMLWHEIFQTAVSGENLNDVETVFIGKSGKEIPVEGSINCAFKDDKPVYLRGIFRNITKRKSEQAEAETMFKVAQEINQKLRQSNNELEDFANIASHDLQEPLRKIISFSEILKVSLKGKLDEDQRENFDFMTDGAKRMQLIIDDLLSFSRITTKAKPSESVDVKNVIDKLQKFELSHVLEETKGTIVIPQPLPVVSGDPTQIHQLFQNLILNGLKFHKDGVAPTVTIRGNLIQNDRVRFDIQDNGIGIDPEYHKQIFTMFKRLHARERYEGTGVGLAICRKIVERHRGEIGVQSTAGKGATFWVSLPRFSKSENTGSEGDGNSAKQ